MWTTYVFLKMEYLGKHRECWMNRVLNQIIFDNGLWLNSYSTIKVLYNSILIELWMAWFVWHVPKLNNKNNAVLSILLVEKNEHFLLEKFSSIKRHDYERLIFKTGLFSSNFYCKNLVAYFQNRLIIKSGLFSRF